MFTYYVATVSGGNKGDAVVLTWLVTVDTDGSEGI